MALSGDSKNGIFAAYQSQSRLSRNDHRASWVTGSRTRGPGVEEMGATRGVGLAEAADSAASRTVAWRTIGTPVICPRRAAPEGRGPLLHDTTGASEGRPNGGADAGDDAAVDR